ncbi:JAB domain-containing protein [Weissella coleopterorum]|uniref:JAB domain-containing protein n=1 Tax=Weissella coleopterorum TaxID=2714949 RepID=A0A6G8AZN3_9LACO|nr:JAB domain-containing protein [Weissella coleopterorum]QIL50524.1 JAB domain-containing protein [Weissella coleopterorum]
MTIVNNLIQKYQRKLGTGPQEECWAVYLDTQAQIIGDFCVAKGSLAQVQIHPRNVFRNSIALNAYAIALNAYAIVLIHNHPSGNLAPSTADVNTARQMAICGTLMQIHLQDFIIISHLHYCSFLEYNFTLHYDVKTIMELWNYGISIQSYQNNS